MSRRCSIAIVNRTSRPVDLNLAQVQTVVDAALADQGVDACQLSVLVVEEAESATLHRRHFGEDSATDVMTFPDGSRDPETGLRLLGDLAICVGVAERVAHERLRRVDDELCLYILHGVLHLLGYDDQDEAEAQRLWSTQQRLMALVGVDIGPEPS